MTRTREINSGLALPVAGELLFPPYSLGFPCGWRIVISPIIPYDSPSCYHSSMRHFVVLFIHLIAIPTLSLAN
jgi:hypothetical protein